MEGGFAILKGDITLLEGVWRDALLFGGMIGYFLLCSSFFNRRSFRPLFPEHGGLVVGMTKNAEKAERTGNTDNPSFGMLLNLNGHFVILVTCFGTFQ